jgi:hypothetical protein
MACGGISMHTDEDRWFSDYERAGLGRRTLDHLLDAIDAGDKVAASSLARRMFNEFLSMHDGYRNWVAALLSDVGRRDGDEALEAIMHTSVAAWWLPNLDTMTARTADRRAQVKMFIAGLRGHLQPIEVDEDDERVILKMTPCGSGGRLVLEGKYDGDDALLTIRTASRITYGRDDFPVYCAHEALMERINIERDGRPLVVVEPSRHLGTEPCSFIIYKDPDAVPASYYERIGLPAPGAAADVADEEGR